MLNSLFGARSCALAAAWIGLSGLVACGDSGLTQTTIAESSPPAPQRPVPPDFPGAVNAIPASPAVGKSRAGQFYNAYIQSPTGNKVAMTVFEPALLEGGRKYPLVLTSHGFTQSRQTTPGGPENAIARLIAKGYGVISIDMAGHGESGGLVKAMDPDQEGKDLIAVVDWAEGRFDWLAYGPSVDGKYSHNLLLGSIGGSYGAMFQYLLHAIDPAHRLDVISAESAPFDLTESLAPGGVVKTAWVPTLSAGSQTSGSKGQGDPYLLEAAARAMATNRAEPELYDYLYYHSHAYFCGSRRVNTNGGPGTQPGLLPLRGDKVHAMIWNGLRDTLYAFNQPYQNFLCYRELGGDVRLLSYETGHNSGRVEQATDLGVRYQPEGASTYDGCGSLHYTDAAIAFLDEHLKGIAGAASIIPTRPCMSLSKGDAVLVEVPLDRSSGRQSQVAIPATTVVAGVLQAPVVVDLGITAGASGDVMAGIPHVDIEVSDPIGAAAVAGREPTIFVGIGHIRAASPETATVPDLMDNQILPVRGFGKHDVDLLAVAERLLPGDRVVLLLYGGHGQYAVNGSVHPASPDAAPVSVKGRVWLPLLGPTPPLP